MRHIFLFAPLLACDPGGSDIGMIGGVDVDTEGPDTNADDGDPATIVVTYSFDGYIVPANCGEARLSTLHVTADPTNTGDTVEFDWPCDDGEIRIESLHPDTWRVTVRGTTLQGPYYEGSHDVVTDDGQTEDLTLVLACEENGTDDGCGMPGQQ